MSLTAVEQLVHEHQALARRVARDFFLPGADRQDVEQEAMIALWVAARSYRADLAGFSTFATLVVRRHLMTVVSAHRRGKHQPLSLSVRENRDEDGTYAPILDSLPGAGCPSEALEQRDRFRAMVAAIRHDLTPRERDAIVSFVFLGESYFTAEGGKNKSIDNALRRARGKLRMATSTLEIAA
jgi:RNA polymerase sporulation-specific sigma factor